MKNDYLWDGTGESDPELERIEKSLAQFRYVGEAPDFAAVNSALRRGNSAGVCAGGLGTHAASSSVALFERARLGCCAALRRTAGRTIRISQCLRQSAIKSWTVTGDG